MNTYQSEFEEHLEQARSLLTGNEDTADLWEANELTNHALYIRPDAPDAWLLKAQILSALDDDIAALAAVEMAVRRAPTMAEAHYWHAAVLADLDRLEESLQAIEKAFANLTPEEDDWLLEDLFYEKALIQEALGCSDAAMATFHRGLERCPDSVILKAGLGPLQRERIRATFKVIQGGLR